MKDARVLHIGTIPCGDPGSTRLTLVHEPDPDDAHRYADEEFDCVICADSVGRTFVSEFDESMACPVLKDTEGKGRSMTRRVEAVLKNPIPDGGIVVDPDVSEAVKERAMAAAPVGITIADARQEGAPLVYVNGAFEELTGYSSAEVLGRNCRFLQGPETDRDTIAEVSDAIRERRPTTVELLNYRKDGTPFWNRLEIAPVEDDSGDVTHFVGFQTDMSARLEAEAAVKNERADLELLLERVNGLLGDVTAALIEAPTRRAIEQGLVEHIAASGPYKGAWVGRTDFTRRLIVPGERAGCEDPPAVEMGSSDPVAKAYDTDRLTVVNCSSRTPCHEGQANAGLAAIPLTYRGTTYGVCCVYADEDTAFGDHERAVLRALGRVAATAINAVEGRRLLASDTVTELELELEEPFPATLARETDAEFAYEGAVFEDEVLRTFYTLERGDVDVVLEAAEASDVVLAARTVADDGPPLFEFDVTPESLVPVLADHGCEVRDIRATPEGMTVAVDLPKAADTRSFVETVRHRFGPVDLVSTRESDRPTRTTRQFRADLEAGLTERQLTALRLAHVGGYFAPQRRATGEELANAMGVSRSTFHQHLRAAQRKLVADFLDPEPTIDDT